MHKKHIHTFAKILILGISILVIAGLVVLWVTRNNLSTPVTPVDNAPQAQQTGPITINNLNSGQLVTLPYTVTGTVKGWFFEGSFPVFIYDTNGNQLGYALATSTEDWMTADPIPFSVTLPVVNYTGQAIITFKKDNPSGEPQFDDSYSVTVIIPQ